MQRGNIEVQFEVYVCGHENCWDYTSHFWKNFLNRKQRVLTLRTKIRHATGQFHTRDEVEDGIWDMKDKGEMLLERSETILHGRNGSFEETQRGESFIPMGWNEWLRDLQTFHKTTLLERINRARQKPTNNVNQEMGVYWNENEVMKGVDQGRREKEEQSIHEVRIQKEKRLREKKRIGLVKRKKK